MTGHTRTVSALAASFAAYLMPIAGTRPGWLGEVLSRELRGGAGSGTAPDPAWIATEVAVALAAQADLFLLAYWFLGRPGLLRGLGSAAALLSMVLLLSHAYRQTIPARFLVEADMAPERPAPTVCHVPGVRLAATTERVSIASNDPIWVVRTRPPRSYGILEAATCSVKALDLTNPAGHISSAAGAHALYKVLGPPGGQRAEFVIDGRSGHLTPVDVPVYSAIISTDGRVTAWLRAVPGGSPLLQLEAVVREIDGPTERVVSLGALGRGDLDLVQIDPAAGTMVVSRPGRELFVVGMDGSLRETLPVPSEIRPQHRSFRYLREG